MKGIKICGTGSYLPDNVVVNDDFTKIVETSDEWIRTRTGIVSRHIADEDTTWSMGVKAAKRAIASAEIKPEEIDLILVTTVSPDYATPSMSCVIQGKIGAVNAACIDLNTACAAFVYALDMAHRYLCFDDIKTVLVISAESLTRLVNFEDRSTCVLFGDGAGAVVVRADDTRPFAAQIGADGTGAEKMFAKHSEHVTPFDKRPKIENDISRHPAKVNQMVMGGRDIYKFATKIMPQILEEACAKVSLTPTDLDWIVPHQANIRIVQTAMKNLGLPMEKAYMNIDHVANTSSASIPLALDEMAQAGKLHRGDKIGMVGFGAGLVYAAAVFEW